jgi:hypothetical protein
MLPLPGLTLEVSCPRRRGALAVRQRIDKAAERPRCRAGVGQLDRRVRHHVLSSERRFV